MKTKPLSSTAFAAGRKVRPNERDEPEKIVVSRGMATTEFSSALAAGARALVAQRFDAQAAHRAFCSVVEVSNFQPVAITGVAVSLDLPALGELGEVSYGFATIGTFSEPVRLHTYAKNVGFSRELIVNDDIGVIRSILAGLGAAAGRVEGGLVYAAMEANPTLDDGEATFHELHGNIVAEAFGWTSLCAAASCLRKQPTKEGNMADLAARHLVVAADLELVARKLVHDSGLDFIVTASASLPPGRWYLLADPATQPTVAVLRLDGARSSVGTDPVKPRGNSDGTPVRVRADLGAVILGRIGIVRGGL